MVNSLEPVLTVDSVGLKDLEKVAALVLSEAGDQRIWLIRGDMGAGKTTFIKALASVIGITDHVSSPTYGIVNEYQDEEGEEYYHFDFYRIENDSEAEDIGAAEYFESGNYCFIEWPEMVERLLPDRFIEINISINGPDSRRIELRKYE